jgi:hypothetical protein
VHVNNLRRYLPAIEIQPKGLLATEACVTVPVLGYPAPALAMRSHFFEFQAADVARCELDSRTLLATELQEGRRYRVIVTNGGGLYRYQLHDEVEVAGFKDEVPLLRFVGKTDDISDLVGEKLHAAHVEAVLLAAFRRLELAPTFSLLRPAPGSAPGYVLQVAAPALRGNARLQQLLCEAVEIGLASNPSYRYARELGQLVAVILEVLDEQSADAIAAKRTADRVASGQRLGDVKPATFWNSL